MRKALLAIASVLALGTAASPASAIQCVPYARQVSGINLKGDAWQWWSAAAGQYERGSNPRTGAVLVFNRQGSMSYGHVSVVTKVVNSRTILVDHANWAPARTSGRGAVSTSVPMIDVSPNNDWSQVRVWYQPSRTYGSRIYRTEGFVYHPQGGSGSVNSAMHVSVMGQSLTFGQTLSTSKKTVEVVKPALSTAATGVRPVAPRIAIAQPVAVKAPAEPPMNNGAPLGKMDQAVSAAKQIFGHEQPVKPTIIFN